MPVMSTGLGMTALMWRELYQQRRASGAVELCSLALRPTSCQRPISWRTNAYVDRLILYSIPMISSSLGPTATASPISFPIRDSIGSSGAVRPPESDARAELNLRSAGRFSKLGCREPCAPIAQIPTDAGCR